MANSGVEADLIGVLAVLQGRAATTETAAGDADLGMGKAEPGLHVHDHGAAQGIEPEHRIGTGQQVDTVDGEAGHHVPVDQVSEAFVDAHAILIDRQPLGLAHDRRGVVAAEGHAGLEGVAAGVGDGDRTQAALQQIRKSGTVGLVQHFAAEALDIGGHLVTADADSRYRRHPHHIHRRDGDAVGCQGRPGAGHCQHQCQGSSPPVHSCPP